MEDILKQFETLFNTYVIKIATAVVILIIGLFVSKLIAGWVRKYSERKDIDPTIAKFLANLVKMFLITMVVIAAIDATGIASFSIVAVLGAAGLAIGLALQGSLQNFAAGVMLVIFRPIRVGDFIEGGGAMGSVEEVGTFFTTLLSPDNKVIIVPNAKLFSDVITNFSVKPTRRVDMIFGIGYADDIDKARNIIKEVMAADERILKDPEPLLAVSELADSSVNFKVAPWVKKEDYWGVFFHLTETIKKKFDENGVSIPFPQTDVHIHKD